MLVFSASLLSGDSEIQAVFILSLPAHQEASKATMTGKKGRKEEAHCWLTALT